MNWIDDQTLYNSEKSLKNEIRIFGIISIILLIMSIVLFIGLLYIVFVKFYHNDDEPNL